MKKKINLNIYNYFELNLKFLLFILIKINKCLLSNSILVKEF
jgi:hypothetical protein